MQVERLRLAGFKSFVEPAELTIAPGLTGIVGPNGCGKSNLVEAVRWVMGEASARRLRGGEMDDVIFNGSATRPARNVAEVAVALSNRERAASSGFSEAAAIEVSRRIVRGSGSEYRVNGRPARGRDVQILFADAASGSHSGALVGQGRVATLIAARPAERRSLIDEAAGTAGLHARRREAELKLQAAEDNLARLDDVVTTLGTQVETLKKQMRQAQRYRRLGEQIRHCEALLLYARWREAAAQAEAFEAALRAAERELAAATNIALADQRRRAEAEANLPALRAEQAAAAAVRQRIAHSSETLEQELKRVLGARAAAEGRQAQLEADLARETERLAEAEAALSRLAAERSELHAAAASGDSERKSAAVRSREAADALASAETGLQQMTEACAAGEARRAALDRQRRELGERRIRLASRLADHQRRQALAAAAVVPPERLSAAADATATAHGEAEAAREAAAAAGVTLTACRAREDEAIEAARAAEHQLTRLTAEADALNRVVSPQQTTTSAAAPLIAQLRASSGFEVATAALFDGELASPLIDPGNSESAAAGWVVLSALPAPPLPEGAKPLAGEVEAPPVLTRRLAYAGWVASGEDGWRLQQKLAPGQCLVDRDGRLWRWDGFMRGGAPAMATAERLRQRNRLDQLAEEIAATSPEATRAAERRAVARGAREAAATAERDAIAALRQAEERLAHARNAEAELGRRASTAEAGLAAIADAIEKLRGDLAEYDQQYAETEQALALLPDPSVAREALEAARIAATAARRGDGEARGLLDRLTREAARRTERLTAITAEEVAWSKLRESVAAQQIVLTDRQTAVAAELADLSARPAAITAEAEALALAATHASARLRDADDALAGGEAALRQATEAARRSDDAVTTAREHRAGCDARRDACAEALTGLRGEIADRLGTNPENLATGAGEGSGGSEELAARFERVVREREAMGPVNLLAETEAAEVEARLRGLETERADLTQAIARLRRGIATLDQEARARLIAAFDQLNGHFAELFGRLFGGGKAELAWADDDDPLVAGLDILASPPGKRLGTLTLLSGGEQALTALALIFAVFQTNPAPLCVLDEVDAPLDDANVDAFCRLIADIADETATRFLVVTHHRVTMGRMDRLFGVTMAERGVSQLVSVDLARAVELRQTA